MPATLRRVLLYAAVFSCITSCATHQALKNSDDYYSKMNQRLILKGNVVEADVLIKPSSTGNLNPNFVYKRHFFFLYDTGRRNERWVKESLALIDLKTIKQEEVI